MLFTTFAKIATVAFMAMTYVTCDVAITSPLMSSWQEGTTQFITWTDNGVEPKMAATFDLALMSGPPTALQLVLEIAKGVDSSKGQYEWKIPATLKPGKDYAIRAGVGGSVSYSPYFELVAGSGDSGASKDSPSKSAGLASGTASPSGSSGTVAPSTSGSSGTSKPSASALTSSSGSSTSASSVSARTPSQPLPPSKSATSSIPSNKTSNAARSTMTALLGLFSLGLVYFSM
ncbi:hypothetical protein K493DRAFT_295680 [Basidiobolus meristosporus CBS 931.73]|uniref:Yeast cell wall synthesis Kre9/Knh1-like N-terminal domain-containing protein n=1 Tax=Basidiobolus meristosporus CBS 931.73 TaxID=1314790 RepID=A0A1Y1ZAB6_9FUNG|nr:hypothetical protein K493DRAFT_295680 [Basidiobolus meristosporus CBS 931.73]|eukprot:ORY07106.1 hypothetical protein K493DRAFT_295680 [Basidiobolus meristosporus CBS 931.73]